MQKNVKENHVFCDLLNNSFVQPFFEIRKNKNFLLPNFGYFTYFLQKMKSRANKSESISNYKKLLFVF